jgi:hypothetical protein
MLGSRRRGGFSKTARSHRGGQRIVESLLIRSANGKSVEQLSTEIRAGQHHNAQSDRRYRRVLAFLCLPRPVRALAWRFVRGTRLFKRPGGTVRHQLGRHVRPGRWFGCYMVPSR